MTRFTVMMNVLAVSLHSNFLFTSKVQIMNYVKVVWHDRLPVNHIRSCGKVEASASALRAYLVNFRISSIFFLLIV